MLRNADGSKTTTQQDIATKATGYHGRLFVPLQADDCDAADDDGMTLRELLMNEFDLWEWQSGVTIEDVKTALGRCPRHKTTGRDEITTEQWHMVAITNEQVAAAMAWATSCRFAHMAPVTTRRAPNGVQSMHMSAESDAQPKDALQAVRGTHARAATHNAESDSLDVTLLPKMANPHCSRPSDPSQYFRPT